MIIIIVSDSIACEIVRNMMCYTGQHRKSGIAITICFFYHFLNILFRNEFFRFICVKVKSVFQ